MASVSTKIQVEGASKFKQDFKDASQAVKSASAELKYFSNELTRTGASEDALKNKISSLNNAFQSEQNAIDMLQDRISKLSQMTGEEAVNETNKWTTELYKHKDAQAQIQAEISETEGELKKFSSGADNATKEVDELGDKSEEAGKQIGDSFASDVGKATVFFNKLADAAIWVGKKIWEIGKDAVEYNAQIETYSRTIEAFFRTSGQSAEEASANTSELIANQKALASQIGVGADVLIEANRNLISAGINGKQAQQSVAALAKSCVAVGASEADMQRMIVNLGEIQSKTKAESMDIKQFAKIGIDLWSLMADATGKTVDQLKEMPITYDMISEALVHATSEGGKFYEASQVGATTLQGEMNTLKSTIRDGLGTAFEPVNAKLHDEVIPRMLEISEGIDWNALGELMADAAEVASVAFGTLAETLSTLAETYGTVKKAVQDWGNVGTRISNDVKNGYLGTAGAFKKAADEQTKVANQSKVYSEKFNLTEQEVARTAQKIPSDISATAPAMAQAGTTAGGAARNALVAQMSGLQSEMAVYGSHAGDGFASGLNMKVPVIASAAARAAGAVRSYMAFTRPDKGPLHDYEQWMPHFVEGLSETMRANEWRLAQSSQELAGVVRNNMVTNNISMNVYGGNQDPNQIANAVMVRIQQATNQRQAVWA